MTCTRVGCEICIAIDAIRRGDPVPEFDARRQFNDWEFYVPSKVTWEVGMMNDDADD